MTQFSLFGSEAVDPAVGDVDGVLLCGGRWVRSPMGARLSVVVAAEARAAALAAEFDRRGLGGEIVEAAEGWSVRSSFVAALADRAASWTRGANEGPPAGFALSAGGLRLWTVATGRMTDAGYLLGTARADEVVHLAAGAQLARLGVAAASVGTRASRGWRITSAKRMRRFAEMVGPAPSEDGGDWPTLERQEGPR